MGQAKQRGSFEQRKQEAKERNKIEKENRIMVEFEIEAAKTPEQKKKEKKAKRKLVQLLGLAASLN